MGNALDDAADLNPLPYHLTVAARLEALEPRAWSLFVDAARTPTAPDGGPAVADPPTDESDGTTADDELEQQLLRHAYRMEPEAHPRVHLAVRRAAEALRIDIPIVVYQLEGQEGANASLVFRPHEAVLALSGGLLALLRDDELVACFGHELAHHRLWTAEGGRVLVADRFLGALSLDAETPPVYLETARRFGLATELYADRGSVVACGNLDVAIASLVKGATGLTDVDAKAFLRQAEAARPDRGAQGTSHPETVLRAWALARWIAGDGDAATSTLLAPSLDIERMDLLDRVHVESLTRGLVLDVLAADWIRSDAVSAHARQFMVDATPSPVAGRDRPSRAATDSAPSSPVAVRLPGNLPVETARFLAYVLLDLATVDPDLGDEPLVEVVAVAREAGLAPAFEEVARRELSLTSRKWEGLQKRALERRVAPPDPDVSPASAPS